MHTDHPLPPDDPTDRATDRATAAATATDSAGPPDAAAVLSAAAVLGHDALLRYVVDVSMKEGEHFGHLPGWGAKPTLFKAGAEKLCVAFQLSPAYEIHEQPRDHGHREYRVLCSLLANSTLTRVGQGVGLCTTQEARFRYRAGAVAPTGQPVPRAYWDLRLADPAAARELLGGAGFSPRKIAGAWMIVRAAPRVENPNPADGYNTVLKLAKKRALVDAVLTATAASDLFTQDLEDLSANLAASGSGSSVGSGGAGESGGLIESVGAVYEDHPPSSDAMHGPRDQADGGPKDEEDAPGSAGPDARAGQWERLRGRMARAGLTDGELLDYLRGRESLEIASLDDLTELQLARVAQHFPRVAAAIAEGPPDASPAAAEAALAAPTLD